MEASYVDEAIELLEKANADLEPELMSMPEARAKLRSYARAQRLVAFGVAALSRKVDNHHELAKLTGTSLGKAKETAATGEVLAASAQLDAALRQGDISLDQATPGSCRARARAAPGAPSWSCW